MAKALAQASGAELDRAGRIVLVLFQWACNYFTRNRAARLITGADAEEKMK